MCDFDTLISILENVETGNFNPQVKKDQAPVTNQAQSCPNTNRNNYGTQGSYGIRHLGFQEPITETNEQSEQNLAQEIETVTKLPGTDSPLN